ncbi:hypothetical protein LSCM1_02324 [Leishmania martiniquensis]|uniref:Uncharacterized protein n=1 Tax=Leishmania martiniquensis TaxID=1580590 RepID=A0A836G888_9TRYP|nr:hypothetical protein LSCM1_02324 [Leishmania martiniquensis]
MSQGLQTEFSLFQYSAGDALNFIVENGSRCQLSGKGASSLPGLSMVVELQERHAVRDRAHKFGIIDDPLYLEDLTHICTHAQWCAHSQSACALTKSAIEQTLHHRSEFRVRRYGEAVMRLADSFPSPVGCDEKAPSPVAGSPSVATTHSASSCVSSPSSAQDYSWLSAKADRPPEADVSLATGDGTSEMPGEDEEEVLEGFLLQHPSFGCDMAAAWLRRRYLRCCDVINARPSNIVQRRLARCVRPALNGACSALLAAKKKCPPSPAPETPATPFNTPAGRSWMTFPGTLRLLREKCTVPYEVHADFSGCADIGQHRRHFIAVLGVLEVCHNTVVSLNLAKTRLHDDEVWVLCLFCRAYLRRLQVLDLSYNKDITDKTAQRLKRLVASLPLLHRLSVRGTSLSRSTWRTMTNILGRKPK